MAYPAATKTLQTWVQEVDRQATLLKTSAQQQHTLSAAGQLNTDFIRRFYDLLIQSNVFFTAAAAVPGIAAYVSAEKQGSVDPASEFAAMQTQVVATLNWLRANLPQGDFGGSNYKLGFMMPVDNVTQISPLTFTAGQTVGYRTILTSLIATVG